MKTPNFPSAARGVGPCAALLLGFSPALAQPAPATPSVDPSAVDAVFEAWDHTWTPGCAVAASRGGLTVLERAYGMADLEHGTPNTPATILEPGSVAKQFTAAATILLSLDGRISLDDDIRDYIPELPDYGEPITIRHLLHHTSGLRDWGSIAAIEGWPRTTRVHTHVHMLDIASRQRHLNYPPGTYYSYTNTGYNLQAVLVERVSGMSFADFTRERIFEPLGMAHTSWRDDFTRIVPGRGIAYTRGRDGEWHMLMPFENVHGNGGLLTTVGDLLLWTRNLDTGELGGARFLEEMHRQGVLDSGRTLAYASGLFVGTYRGLREIQHSGGTAGYRGFLTRFPEAGLAVALMCNAGDANPAQLAHRVADLLLPDATADAGETAVEGIELPRERLAELAGLYRDTRRGSVLRITQSGATLRAMGVALVPQSNRGFASAEGIAIEFDEAPAGGGRPAGTLVTPDGNAIRIEPVERVIPAPAELEAYAGTFRSEEAEATYRTEVRDGRLVWIDRYGEATPLSPTYRDAFAGPGGAYVFERDPAGRVVRLHLGTGRVWDLVFTRIDGTARG